MVGLTVQNFVSAAAGMAVMAALIRGLARRRADTIGNFWVDLTRTTLRILLPIAFVGALVYVGTGVVQNLHGFEVVKTLERNTQVIPGGPAASQEAMKMLGTNGGGFFNVNSAHPLSNPNGFSDLFGIFFILLIPVSLTYTYGKMVGSIRQGMVLLAVMVVIWVLVVGLTTMFELNGNPKLDALKVNQATLVDHARRQPRGQGGAIRHACLRARGVHRRPERPTARSTRCTTASPRSAG